MALAYLEDFCSAGMCYNLVEATFLTHQLASIFTQILFHLSGASWDVKVNLLVDVEFKATNLEH